MFGKLSFGPEKLKENFKAVYDAVVQAKPAKAKLPYIKSLYVTSTMGPSIKIDLNNL